MDRVKLFDPKFVYFMGKKETMIGKNGFCSDSIGRLRDSVEENTQPCECIDVDESAWVDHPFKTKKDGFIYACTFFYYDPNYEVKWAYFKEGKKLQELWPYKGWRDVDEVYGEIYNPYWFDDHDGEFRIKPENDDHITLEVNGERIRLCKECSGKITNLFKQGE